KVSKIASSLSGHKIIQLPQCGSSSGIGMVSPSEMPIRKPSQNGGRAGECRTRHPSVATVEHAPKAIRKSNSGTGDRAVFVKDMVHIFVIALSRKHLGSSLVR